MADKGASDGSPDVFEPGTLLQMTRDTSVAALNSGALRPISTYQELSEDCGVQFLIRRVNREAAVRRGPAAVNPFLPYDPALFVSYASETHVCLLNKFCVFDGHLLLVTREFEHQQSPLTCNDFAALAKCLAEFDSLGFYNAGPTAGASQPHKHLQLVSLPLASKADRIPLDPLSAPSSRKMSAQQTAIWPPFASAVAALTWDPAHSELARGAALLSTYQELLARLRLDVHTQPATAYNLLVTRAWMMIVPRLYERFGTMSLNALAFAGALLVRSESQLRALQQHGPMSALRYVAGPA